jgi:hypothetical protein
MNTWGSIKKLAIVEADDFQDKYDRNGLEMLFYWKAKYPKFKITLFTIPNKTSLEFKRLIARHSDWIQLAVHGWDHDSNFECWGWDYEKTKQLMIRTQSVIPTGLREDQPYEKIFKAPGWTITGEAVRDAEGKVIGGKYSGYPPTDELPIAKDKQAVYRALQDLDFIVFDRHYDKEARPEGLKVVCVDCNPDIIHMHTWDMVTGDLQGKNGFRQVEELHGVPWDQETEFKFVSEAWEEGLFKECQP